MNVIANPRPAIAKIAPERLDVSFTEPKPAAAGAQPARGLAPIDAWHVDVHQHQVEPFLGPQGQGGLAAVRQHG